MGHELTVDMLSTDDLYGGCFEAKDSSAAPSSVALYEQEIKEVAIVLFSMLFLHGMTAVITQSNHVLLPFIYTPVE